ncbi:recombination-associated protein RdgC [Desulfonema magnum]|uniref:Exonuclease family protein n=1 Tax=Desulfonema magnum TaxID=45655 RepID=A0A975BG87_9BACT|nr:recombination-associated protein RdgC [Desulfonema magnum]QTA84639.1 Exonuclease family protein [Desulfonema magnum]
MGLLSASVSVTRYKVEGEFETPVLETITDGLSKNVITDIDGDIAESVVGWTSFENPFKPDFKGSSFVIGTYLVFSLRIDKKTVPSKIVKKHYTLEMAKQLAESGREHLSRNEKRLLKENVVSMLNQRTLATPNIYDIIWNKEDALLWFFSTQKAANEALETLFSKSFKLTLIRLFPYTIADLMTDLSDTERDTLSGISPTKFTE